MELLKDILVEKVALVTGACGGIGRAICERLASDGVRLVLVDLDTKEAKRAASTLKTDTFNIGLDIGDPSAVSDAHDLVSKEFGDVDILVNCAGVLSNNKLLDTSPKEWRKVMAVNLDGALYWSQAVLPSMKQKRFGRIINISSFAWKAGGLTAGTAYTASKGGMVSLTFSIALEFANAGITANGIAPCYVMTPMVSEQLSEEQRQATLDLLPVKRFCSPEEVAHAVRFIASPLAGFITGEIIDMNGGLHFD